MTPPPMYRPDPLRFRQIHLDFIQHRGRVNFVVPRIEGHQMVEVVF